MSYCIVSDVARVKCDEAVFVYLSKEYPGPGRGIFPREYYVGLLTPHSLLQVEYTVRDGCFWCTV